jgi:hypothetical protein
MIIMDRYAALRKTQKKWKALIEQYPWARGRGMKYDVGWFGLIENMCKEITDRYAAHGKEIDITIYDMDNKYSELSIDCSDGAVDISDLTENV